MFGFIKINGSKVDKTFGELTSSSSLSLPHILAFVSVLPTFVFVPPTRSDV